MEKNGDPDDARRWGLLGPHRHRPESRLVVSVVDGKRTAGAVSEVVRNVYRRTGGRAVRRMASDEYPADPDAIRAAGPAPRPYTVAPPGVTCATVHVRREENRVNRVRARVVFGTLVAVALALVRSAVRRAAHTSPVERHNGTDRNRCRRKARKGFGFSKDWDVHRAATRFSHFSYNFCRRSGR